MDRKKRLVVVGLLLAVVLVVTLALVNRKQEPQKVSIVLSWFATGLNAPHYLAEDLGYYADEGLTVEILEGKGSGQAVKLVGNGTNTFGVADAAAMAQSIGAGVPVTMVAGLVQKSPVAILSRPNSGMTTPESLRGKQIVMPPDSGQAQMFPVFLALNDLEGAVTVLSAEATASINLVLNEKADGVGNYAPTAYTIMEEALGEPPTILYYADYGVQTLSSGLVVNNNTLKKNPELVAKFTRATVRGWEAARENPRAAAESYVKRFPELDVDSITKMVEGFTSLMSTEYTKDMPVGWMSEEDWLQTLDILEASGMLQQRDADMSKYYTNEFITK
ncbi:MAG TPA: ABC transporter substrate-binding protein [Firmicutes bacterium]|jgi:NitT/TauT family transport system substrate-binding protein|nr:ABC transporter substrate-binding protein [Bacillota bacterium]